MAQMLSIEHDTTSTQNLQAKIKKAETLSCFGFCIQKTNLTLVNKVED